MLVKHYKKLISIMILQNCYNNTLFAAVKEDVCE